ncbi:GGDEF domain-containing protein [Alkalihalophilus lindianensis]|uniref:GGDEF domain-containing protein n=1 Tax=Alkalihalophilus lindianensis TaxID=1630542 RepID=A0ABU3XE05_9BACI|nr:GGDEF domain-containing protein [Alkalihalophilus lindianensis]MDV2686126.1 GGDEF domain-containing protein [Alkalihalophilus lindianensis]
MKKWIFWPVIVLFTFAPFLLMIFLERLTGTIFHFVWSLYLIPTIFIIMMYPKWRIIITTALFFSLLKYTAELTFVTFLTRMDVIVLILSTLINWAIIVIVAYFRMKYEQMFLQVRALTLIDPLTNLYNRRYFDLLLENAIPHSERVDCPLTLLLLDIDHFKKVNDTHGHVCGDQALQHISQLIKDNVRSSDAYVRFGGEEFAIIMQDTSLNEGKVVAERICKQVESSPFIYKGKTIHLTISIGIALYVGEKKEEFIERADKALYEAKRGGRNQVALYETISC